MARNIFAVYDSEFSYVELLQRILDPVPHSTLAILSGASRPLRKLVHDLFRGRAIYFTRLFIPREMVADFFDLLDMTNAAIAGGLVRCIISNEMFGHFKDVNPSQLNIILPYTSGTSEQQDRRLRTWLRFLHACGYKPCTPEHEATNSLRASCNRWIYLTAGPGSFRSISLIESRSNSIFPPIFQASQTSSFYAMSSTKIYTMYPGLHEASINVSLRPQSHRGILDDFNHGLFSMRSTEEWEAFSQNCGEACPAVHRFTKNYPGWRVISWGGITGNADFGGGIEKADPYEEGDFIWKLPGNCSRQTCSNFFLYVDLFEETV